MAYVDSGHPQATATALSVLCWEPGERKEGGLRSPLLLVGAMLGTSLVPCRWQGGLGSPRRDGVGREIRMAKGRVWLQLETVGLRWKSLLPSASLPWQGWDKAAWHRGEEEEEAVEGSLHFNPPAAGAKCCHPSLLLFSFWFCCRTFRLK